MPNDDSDVIIVGGGIIGLASAFALAHRNLAVTLLDPAPATGSSFAAAGMLAPGAESTPEHAGLTTRSISSLGRWDSFAAEISATSAQLVTVQHSGSLFVGHDASDRRELTRYLELAATQGIESRAINSVTDAWAFKGLSPRCSEGHFVTGDSYVDAQELLHALIKSCEALGVEFVASRALDCQVVGSEVLASTEKSEHRARCGILATGFQPEPLDILASGHQKLRPVRGVTLRLQLDRGSDGPMIRGVVGGRMVYVIRRPDGSAIVGASSDESALAIVEAGSVRRLLEDASTLIPEIDDAALVDVRVGLRPASSDHHPFFEQLGDGPWAWSSGHFRHGILLAPLAAEDAVQFAKQFME